MARLYELKCGDVITLSEDSTNSLHLVEKVKNPNRKWFQFWKSKYICTKWMFV